MIQRKTRTPEDEERDPPPYSRNQEGYKVYLIDLAKCDELLPVATSEMRLMSQIDPGGTNIRKKHPLSWRIYVSRVALCVACKWLRKVKVTWIRHPWSTVDASYVSNNSPAVIASYYLDTLNELGILHKYASRF
jgi:hypothetical protein